MCTKNDNHIMYDSWDTEWDRGNFLSFWAIFCPFTPLAICQNKKAAGDIIGLHKCTINDSHIMYGSWEMEHDGQNLFKFWAIFYPLTTWKSKILKKWKKPRDIITLHKCTKKHDYMLHCSWDTARNRCNIHFSFWAIFCSLPL